MTPLNLMLGSICLFAATFVAYLIAAMVDHVVLENRRGPFWWSIFILLLLLSLTVSVVGIIFGAAWLGLTYLGVL
jgi:hypothetical protein